MQQLPPPPRKIRAYAAIGFLVASFCLPAQALINPQALASDHGRLNHPVLFIPGLQGSPEHFGMNTAEPVCSEPYYYSSGTSAQVIQRDTTVMVSVTYRRSSSSRAFQVPVMPRTIQVAKAMKAYVLSLHAKVYCNSYVPIEVTREVLIEVRSDFFGVMPDIIPVLFPITIEPGGIYRSGNARISIPEILEAMDGKTIGSLRPDAEIEQWWANLKAADRIDSYRPKSAPALLASHFGLNTNFDRDEFGPYEGWSPPTVDPKVVRSSKGINANGIYVFQAKSVQTPWQVCQDPVPLFHSVQTGYVWDRSFTISQQVNASASGVENNAIVASVPPVDGGVLEYTKKPAVKLSVRLECNGIAYDASHGLGVAIIRLSDYGPKEYKTTPLEPNYFEDADFEVSVSEGTNPNTLLFRKAGSNQKTYAYDYTNLADGLSYPLAPQYLPDEDVLPDWTGSGMAGGQSDQLYIRMQDVLDEFYGIGKWETNPDAQIDLVGHSMGGLVIREMIAHAKDNVPRNPISHIRQILTVGTPLHGTALTTSNDVLRKASSELDADLGQRTYGALASLRDGLVDGKVVCDDPSLRTGCLKLEAPIDIHGQNGSLSVVNSIVGPWLGPYSLKVAMGKLDFVDEDNIDLGVREKLAGMAKNAEFLGWPQNSAFISSLVYDNENKYAPRYPGTVEFIPFTTLSSASVGNFLQGGVAAIAEGLRNACPPGSKLWQREVSGFGITVFRSWITCNDFHSSINTIEEQIATQLSPIDEDWSTRGDLFVDLPSQKGFRTSGFGWDPSRNDRFKVSSFAYNSNVLHGPFSKPITQDMHLATGVRLQPLLIKAQFPGASMQGCDILDQLGVVSYDRTECKEPEATGFQSANKAIALSEVLSIGSDAGTAFELNRIRLRLRNTTMHSLFGLVLDVPVLADPQATPTATLNGAPGAGVEMIPVASGAWLARITSSAPMAPSTLWPSPEGFKLEISEPQGMPVRIGVSVSPDWRKTVQVVVRTAEGEELSGIDPTPTLLNYSSSIASSPFVDLLPSGYQSRGSDLKWTKPVINFQNGSDRRIENFDLFYRVQARDGMRPEIELWNTPSSVASITTDLQADGDSGWFAIFHFSGMQLQPGQELRELRFGLHWPDWSDWDVTRDSSEPGSSSETDIELPAVDVDAVSFPSFTDLDPIPGTGSCEVEGFDEGLAEANYVKPRLRLTNKGNTSVNGFTIRIPVTVPSGIDPVLESFYVPGCVGSLTGTDASRVVVFSCPDANVAPGVVWPDAAGIIFGLHDRSWNPWTRGGDTFTGELGSNWKSVHAPEVVQ